MWHLLFIKLIEQFDLVILSTLIALVVAVPLGIIVFRFERLKRFTLSAASVLWTIPSLALLAFFIPFLGIGIKPAIIVLSIYALLPILRNVIVGLENISPKMIEAANGLGFTKCQRLYMVELPLAFPVMIAGIRTAVSITVGVATLAAFIGAGGLGDFINQGLAMSDTSLLLWGAIPAAVMAVCLDMMIGFFEKDIHLKDRTAIFHRIKQVFVYSLALLIILFLAGRAIYKDFGTQSDNTVIVATKNFTEQFILGQMIVQMLQAHTDLNVETKFNLGATSLVQKALLRGDVDMYPEYTGTAYTVVLHQKKTGTPQQIFDYVKDEYQKRFHLTWLPPFGYNNTEAIIVKQSFAKQHQLNSISDLKAIDSNLTIGAPAGFLKRPDGFRGLKEVYGLNFKSIKQMNPGLMYQAIRTNSVNVIAGFSTDGRITAYHLKILKDNKHFYPPYYAAIVIREQTLKQHPQIYVALKPLFGLINDKTMQRLNYEADIEKKSPKLIAYEFLKQHHLL